MFEYTICTVPDKEIFYKQCAALEKHIPNLEKERLLHDVDDTLIQIYMLQGNTIKVLNDMTLGWVRIESEMELEPFFPKVTA